MSISKRPNASKYGLDLSALETIAAPAVRGAVQPRQLVVIDEIGPMVRPDDLDRLISELSERIQALNLG